jgi:hypothetical protein
VRAGNGRSGAYLSARRHSDLHASAVAQKEMALSARETRLRHVMDALERAAADG